MNGPSKKRMMRKWMNFLDAEKNDKPREKNVAA
jgi:hypothetical protein